MHDSTAAQGDATLRKTLRPRHLTMISIGGMIGSGLFIGSSAAIAAAGPAIVLSYALAGVLVLLVMRILAEMAAASPETGSFTEYVRLGLGDWAGFLSGWLYWYFWVLAIALEALAGASILQAWIPLPVWQLGFALLIVLTCVNLLSTRAFGEAEFALSSIKVVALALFLLLGGAYLLGLTPGTPAAQATLLGNGGFFPLGVGAALAGITTVVFALVGAEIVTIAAAESNAGGTAVARLTTMLVVRIAIFFVASMLMVVTIVPWTAVQPGASPFGLALEQMRIPYVPQVMNAVVLVAVLSCLNAGFYVSSRVLFVLAARREAPGWIVRTNARGVPVRAVLAGSLVSALALIGSIYAPQDMFAFLINASGTAMLLIYLLLAMAQIAWRRTIERDAPERLVVRSWGYPATSYAVVIAIVAVLGSMALDPGLRIQLLSGLGLSAAVAAAYGTMRVFCDPVAPVRDVPA